MFTAPAPLIGFEIVTFDAVAPPVSATFSPPMFEQPNTLQRLLLMLSAFPPPENPTSPPATLRSELPLTLASGPFRMLSVLPFERRTRSLPTARLLPLRTLTSAP